MIFESIDKLCTVVELGELKNDPELIYRHFMQYGDEAFYVLKGW